MTSILVVDDDPGLRHSVSLLLSGEGYDVTAEGDSTAALRRATEEPVDVILCDVKMPGMDGLDFLRRYRAASGGALVIMMSAYGGEEAAVAAMKEGAYDYIPKPLRSDEVILTLRKALERERLRGRVAVLEAELARWSDPDLVAESPAMRQVLDIATRVAAHQTTLLITGESGTGKEVVARAVHRMSPRRERPFVAVNCGAIPENLLESELFGYVRGAFTGANEDRTGLFEAAHNGTLLLDEIGELPPGLQVKLLRVLQESEIRKVGDSRNRRVDVRVIAATARNLEDDVRAGRFREDLFYRLNVVRIHLPALRERPEDLPALVNTLLQRITRRSGRPLALDPAALELIRAHSWPGNVRELENALERAAVLSTGSSLRGEAFSFVQAAERPDGKADARVGRLSDAVEQTERQTITAALAAVDQNRSAAAGLLGISVRSLFYKMKQLGL